MTTIPKKAGTAPLHPQGLQCKNPQCGMGIALGGDLDTLPASFEATCPVCRVTGTYRSDEIQTLDRVLKQ